MPLFASLTYQELNRLDREETLVVLPTGCTEQQGPHLAVGFDTWFVQELCEEVGRRLARLGVTALIMPTTPYGPTPEHRSYGGYVNLEQATFERLLADALESLIEQGFMRFVIWRGCGGHRLDHWARRFEEAHKGIARVWVPPHPYNEVWQEVASEAVPGGHADSFTTSVALYKHPECVRLDRVPPPSEGTPDFDDPNADWRLVSDSGVVGDATRASPELGKRLWNRTVERVTAILAALVAN